jgi:hypothetical protein
LIFNLFLEGLDKSFIGGVFENAVELIAVVPNQADILSYYVID